MQQSNVIFANLFIAYFLFITMKGELPQYIDLIRGGGQQATNSAAASGNAVVQGAEALLNNNPMGGASSSIQSEVGNLWQLPPPGAGATDFLTQLTGP